MLTNRNIPYSVLLISQWKYWIAYTLYLLAVILIYEYLTKLISIPFLPVSIIGIAVSFYIGFKNNASNERLNEARRNWGFITNESRSFVSMLLLYIPESHSDTVKIIVNRHLAWLYTHKYYLRFRRMSWEHSGQINNAFRKRFIERNGIPEKPDYHLDKYLSKEDKEWVLKQANPATHLLNLQSQTLKNLEMTGVLGEFKIYELQRQINNFYTAQGVNERIKTFPFQRQYANFGKLFVNIFSFLLPLGLLKEFDNPQLGNVWSLLPLGLVVYLVFHLMELVGDYSENPFEGLINDVPITSITRNIEIDLLQLLKETDIPEPINSARGVIM